MLMYLETISSNGNAGNNTALRKARQRISEVRNLDEVVNSLKQSKQPVQRGKLLILGDRDAGKTSTKKSLMGENFDQIKDETHGVNICSVDISWNEITEPKTSSAPAVEAKLFALGALKDREEMQKNRLTTHEIYRQVLGLFFQKLEPWIGSSVYAKVITFYLVLLFFVCLSGLRIAIAVHMLIFLVLEVHRGVKMKSFDLRGWRKALYGILIGTGIGNILNQTLIIPAAPFLPTIFCEIFQCVLLFATAELLVLPKRLMIILPGWLINLLDVMYIPADSVSHFCIIGTAFEFCFTGTTTSCHLSYCCVLLIWALQVEYLTQIMFLNCFSKILLALEFFFATFFVIYETAVGFIICFVLCDELLSRAVASCRRLQVIYHRDDISLVDFIKELIVSSHPFCKASELLANPSQLKKEIEAIRAKRMQLLDFAGDVDYYCYHHIFLAQKNAIYLIVFNYDLATNGGSKMDEKFVKSIWFWLESIAMQNQQHNCVFLVATHCYGKTEDDYQKVNDLLESNFDSLFANKIFQNTERNLIFFPVENKNGPQDGGVCILRKEIINRANKMFNDEVQLHCFKLEDEIADLRKRNKADELCIPIEEFQSLMKRCKVEVGRNEQVMDYLFNQGLILFTREANGELPSWLLLEPRLLVDIIIKLVTYPDQVKKQEPHLRRDWKILRNVGFVTSELLSHLLSPFGDGGNVMRSFLEAVNIICSVEKSLLTNQLCVSPEYTLTHFVPALLPDNPTRKFHPSDSQKLFYIFFKRFLPEMIFYSLMAHAFEISVLNCPDDKPEVHKGWGLFWLAGRDNCQNCYELLLQKEKGVIEVKFNDSDPSRLTPADVLLHVAEMMNTVCKRSFPHLDFHCGPACPSTECPGDMEPITSYLNYHRQKPRPHVFNIYPRCKERMNVVSFNCRYFSFERELKEWVPKRE